MQLIFVRFNSACLAAENLDKNNDAVEFTKVNLEKTGFTELGLVANVMRRLAPVERSASGDLPSNCMHSRHQVRSP